MAIDLILSPDQHSSEPLEQARRKFLSRLAEVQVPYLGSWADAQDLLATRDMLHEVATIADAWLQAVGDEINLYVSHNMQLDLFDKQFSGAIDGRAAFELERAANILRSEDMEQAA